MSALAIQAGLSLLGAIRVFGSSVCPSPQEVEAEVAKSPPATAGGEIARARLERDSESGALRIILYDANGTPRGTRVLPADGSCSVMALAAATLLRSLDLTFDVAVPPVPLLAFEAPATAVEIGAGGLASFTGDGSGAAFLVLGSMGAADWIILPELTLQVQTPRRLAVGTSGQASWWRIWAAPGIEWRLVRRPSYWLSLQALVPLGASFASGNGYPLDQAGAAFDMGLSAGIRVGLGAGSHSPNARATLLPWAGAWAIAWTLPHTLIVSGETSSALLPWLEAAVGLGLSWSER